MSNVSSKQFRTWCGVGGGAALLIATATMSAIRSTSPGPSAPVATISPITKQAEASYGERVTLIKPPDASVAATADLLEEFLKGKTPLPTETELADWESRRAHYRDLVAQAKALRSELTGHSQPSTLELTAAPSAQ